MESIQKHVPHTIAVRKSGSCRVDHSHVSQSGVVYYGKEKCLIWEKRSSTTVVRWELLGKPEEASPPWTNLMLMLMLPKIHVRVHALNCIELRLLLLAGRKAKLLSVPNFSKVVLQAIFSGHLTSSCFIVDSSTVLTVRIKTK